MATSQKKKYGERKTSPILEAMMRRAPTTMLRDCRYNRGFSLENDPVYRSIAKLSFCHQGLFCFTLPVNDLVPDASNVQGTVVLNAIENGKYLEAFKTLVDPVMGEQGPLPVNLPDKEFLLSQTRHFAVSGRVFMEVDSGFAPYIFLGYQAEGEKYARFVRIQIDLKHETTKRWFNELKAAAARTVY